MRQPVVTGHVAKRVLAAVADALPDEGDGVLTRLELRDSWGGSVLVRVHSMLLRTDDEQLHARVGSAVAQALGDRRHVVEVVWGSAG